MKDKTLVKMAFFSSIIGVAMLFVVSSFMAVPERDIANLSSQDISKTVKIIGKVVKVQDGSKVAKMTVEQPTYIDAVIFKEGPEDLGFKAGQQVEIIGEYREVKGMKELVIDEAKLKTMKEDKAK